MAGRLVNALGSAAATAVYAPGPRAACAEPNACPVFAAVMCRAEVDNRGFLIG